MVGLLWRSWGGSPGRILLLLSLHHVPETGVSQSLGEVRVRSHEAVVIKAWSQAGGAETESFALRAAGSTQNAFMLRRQVGPKQGLQQLKKELGFL